MSKQTKELYEKLMRLQRILRRFQFHTKIANGPMSDTAQGQGRVMAILKMRPEISVGDLAYLLGIRASSLNELLNRLEKGGYITRTASEEDKRVVIVRLTEKGKNEELPDTGVESMFDCLNEGERKTLGEYLDRILAALKDKVGDERDDFDLMKALRQRKGEQFGRDFERFGRGVERFGEDFERKMRGFFDGFHGGEDADCAEDPDDGAEAGEKRGDNDGEGQDDGGKVD
ncbi:MAG: MarR family transcriptional regulator [Clostridiales bacterium]|jgi:DNA-binding MarR family transcriptional regulator|nr:MarR family transcriptional regulator [Clostridiales bacterium]